MNKLWLNPVISSKQSCFIYYWSCNIKWKVNKSYTSYIWLNKSQVSVFNYLLASVWYLHRQDDAFGWVGKNVWLRWSGWMGVSALWYATPFAPNAMSTCWERANTSLSRPHGLALFRSVPVQSCSRCELQFLLQAKHLGAVHTHLFLQLPLLPQFQDALLLSRFRGPPDKPLQVVAHCSHHKGHGEGDIRGIGPHRCPN